MTCRFCRGSREGGGGGRGGGECECVGKVSERAEKVGYKSDNGIKVDLKLPNTRRDSRGKMWVR